MSEFFYVLGLPRSRTLWLSFLLSDHETKCYHERLSGVASEPLTDEPFKYVGSVDTNPINEIEYNGPLAIIKRDPEDVKKSITDWFGTDEKFTSDYIDMYSKALSQKDALIIDYKDLDNADVIKKLIKHLKPESVVTDSNIEYMINCIIKTKNKDVSGVLEATTSFVDHMTAGTVTAQRIYDVRVVLAIISEPKIFDAISEDGASMPMVDVINQHWVGFFVGAKIIGVAQFRQLSSHVWDSHIHILPEYRKEHSAQAGKVITEWFSENLKGSAMVCTVPDTCKNVVRFVESIGFKRCGLIENVWLKNGELHNVNLFQLRG